MRRSIVITFALALAALLSGEAWAQTGTVTGTVTDAGTLAPVSSAQVFIPGLQIGTLTQANGRYLLVNVPAGTHTVRAERIGYATVEQEVTVAADQAMEVNIMMAEDVLALDEIVVTGTAGQARRREIGNTIAQVNMADVAAGARSVGSMLQGRLAGVRIIEGGGYSGAGADIRLRGNVSMSMSNQPLVYIDGVRAKSEPYPNPQGINWDLGGSLQLSNPLDDISPEDIERIEIVKGPAATTLYGTEAAAGVIQIFTKKGGTGAAQWTVDISEGASYMRPHYGNTEAPRLYADPILRHGLRQNYGLSVRGGTDDLGYYVSGSFKDNQAAFETQWDKGVALRANMQLRPADDVQLEFNNSFTRTQVSNPHAGGTGYSLYFALGRGDKAGYGFGTGARSAEILPIYLEQSNFNYMDRYVNGLTVNYTPSDNFTHRLTLGHDLASFDTESIYPFCWRCDAGGGFNATAPGADAGRIYVMASANRLWSIDYVGTLGFDLTSNVRSTFSFGFQGVQNTEESVRASGRDFPGPGDYTISSTARKSANQDRLRVITGGFFLQDMLALSDKYFLTAGLRVDGNSAFGSGLGLQPYPKVSMSYVLSDEDFWPETLGQTKLRAAYGWAGRAPGAFDAVRTWDPVGWGDTQAAFAPQNQGNPDLGPERTRELEVGFDASVLDGRVSADVTYYSQTTTDALFNVPSAGSGGGWNSQLQNVGEISNSGFEVTLNATLFQASSFQWDVGGGLMTNKSEVVSLGDSPPFSVGNGGWVIEGQPAPVIRADWIENYYSPGEPDITKNKLLGPAFPTTLLQANTSLTLPGGIQISGRGEFQGGHYIRNSDESGIMGRFIPSTPCFDAYRKVEPGWELGPPHQERDIPVPPAGQAFPADVLAWERANCFGQFSGTLSTQPSDYFELRDVTVMVPISNLVESLSGLANRIDLTASWKNAWGWKNNRLRFGHPESGTEGSDGFRLVKNISRGLPIQSYYTFALRAVF